MKKNLKPTFCSHARLPLLLFFFLWNPFHSSEAFSSPKLSISAISILSTQIQSPYSFPEDTIKYKGYRLNLSDFKVLKTSNTWVKVEFTVTNTGREDVDFSKKGREHWVQINFDQSIFDNKLGGLRENIRRTLYQENFSLKAGKVIRQKDLKVPLALVNVPQPDQEVGPGFVERKVKTVTTLPSSTTVIGDTLPAPTNYTEESAGCPDIFFEELKILKQDSKWATLEYSVKNKGTASFQIFGTGQKIERLVIRAYISGATILSRGALPIGDHFVKYQSEIPAELQPGQSFKGKIRLDVRKKTRYMKSLILSLDSDQFAFECDKTNNTGAVILD